MTFQEVLSRFPGAKRNGSGYTCRCPAHEPPGERHNPSLSIRSGGDGRTLIHCHAGCTTQAILRAVGLTTADLFPERNGHTGRRIVATYQYRDENGQLLYEVVRFDPKDFRQRRPNGRGGWTWSLDGVRRVLYRLPELLAADPKRWVLVVEGEKDADRLARLGFLTTTIPGGAGKWRDEYDTTLAGRPVAIFPDNDATGRNHAETVARSLQGKVAKLKILDLPGVPPKGDVSDYLDAGHTADDLRKLIESAASYQPQTQAAEPAAAEPPPETWKDFPIEALPEPLARFASETAAALGCDPAYVALPVLAVTAAAIGTTREIQLKGSWAEPAIVWAGLVARSGTLKSPAFDAAVAPLRHAQIEALREHEAAREQHEREMLVYEAELAAWRKSRHGEPPEKPQAPTPTRFVVGDVTVEALAPILSENQRGLLLARDELAGWVRGFDAYKGGRGGDAAAWLELWRAGTLIVDRKGGDRRTIYIPRAAASVCGTIQPGTLAAVLTTEHFESGLAARLLLANPPERRKKWSNRVPSAAARDEYERTLHALLALEHAEGEHGPEPMALTLTPEARARWSAWYDRHAERIYTAGSDRDAAALAKIEAYAARFALVFALATDPRTTVVNGAAVAAGCTLANWFAGEARRVYSAMAETDEVRELVGWIARRGGSVTVRDLTRGPRQYRGDADGARAALAALVEAGRGRWVHNTPAPDGGRPSDRFELVTEPTDCDPGDTGGGDETPAGEPENRGFGSVAGFRNDDSVTTPGAGEWGEL